MVSISQLQKLPLRRTSLAIIAFACVVCAGVTWASLARAYSFTGGPFYLWDYTYSDYGYISFNETYGPWNCPSWCELYVSSTDQYIDIENLAMSFSCWYQEVDDYGPFEQQSHSHNFTYASTPIHEHVDWLMWANVPGPTADEDIWSSFGTAGYECAPYGAASGAYIAVGVFNKSTAGYLIDMGNY